MLREKLGKFKYSAHANQEMDHQQWRLHLPVLIMVFKCILVHNLIFYKFSNL